MSLQTTMGSTHKTIYMPDIQQIAVPLPPIRDQREIADFLDAETTRIDSLIEKKRRLIRLAQTRHELRASAVIWHGVKQRTPLMHRTQWDRPIMYGIVLPGPDMPDGIPIVKGGDVAAGRLSPELLNRTTREIEAPYARARLSAGDLVFAIRGGIGDVDIVPESLAGANITQDVARVAPASDVNPFWLRAVLRTDRVCAQVGARVTGATIKGLNIWDLKRIQIPPSDAGRQAQDLQRLVPDSERTRRLIASLTRQIELLVEHRSALITAAVTGELNLAKAVA